MSVNSDLAWMIPSQRKEVTHKTFLLEALRLQLINCSEVSFKLELCQGRSSCFWIAVAKTFYYYFKDHLQHIPKQKILGSIKIMQKCSSLFIRNSISIKIRWRGSTENHSWPWSFWTWTPFVKVCALQAQGLVSTAAAFPGEQFGETTLSSSLNLSLYRCSAPSSLLTWLGECCFILNLLSLTWHPMCWGLSSSESSGFCCALLGLCNAAWAQESIDWAGGNSVGSRSHTGDVRCYREGKDCWSLFPCKMQTDVFDFAVSWQFPQMHQLTWAYYKVNKEFLHNNLQLYSWSQSWHRWDTLLYIN